MGKAFYNSLTKEQRRIDDICHREAREWFGIYGNTNLVLHHKDEELRHRNIDRYILWLPDDLIVLTQTEHSKLHNSGKKNGNYGKHHTEEQKRKSRESHLGEKNGMYGKPSPMRGKHQSEEAKQKNREAHLGKPSPRKGTHLSEEAKQKNREAHLGSHHTDEAKNKIGEASKKMWQRKRLEKILKYYENRRCVE